MKRIHIQIQPNRSPEMDLDQAISRLSSLADGCRVTEGEDDGRYLNIDFQVDDPAGLWTLIREELRSDPRLAETAIVIVEGEHGWDDYLLLRHFDEQQPVDPFG